MLEVKDPNLLGPTGFDDVGPPIKEDCIYSDRDVAKLLFKDKMTPWSVKTVQQWARSGELRGRKTGYRWTFYGRAVKDFLLRK